MAHWSENCQRLDIQTHSITQIQQCEKIVNSSAPAVYLFWFPAERDDSDAARSEEAFQSFADLCANLHQESIVSILTTPPDAARLLPYLESALKFQLWIAVKLFRNVYSPANGILVNGHAALLVLTRYRASLRHTKTRIQYSYCPACGKTTKDYGGKKHVYHEYGTLMSDVWRDIECDSYYDIEPITERLRDVFGLEPYRTLHLLDLRRCAELSTCFYEVREAQLPFEWQRTKQDLEPRLMNADCLEALRTLPNNSVDFCFADPPYNLQKKYDHWNDALESVEYFKWCDHWLAELARVLRPGRTLAVVNLPLWAVRHYQYLCSVLRFQTWIVWEALGFPVRFIMPAHYTILCFSKGDPRPLPGLSATEYPMLDREALTPSAEFFCLRADCMMKRRSQGITDSGELSDLWSDIHRLKHNSRRVDHPCQLPPKLMQRLFALFTQPGEAILDCFNGAGTSTLVAQQMGRRFIGIEISEQYHKLALQRHEQLTRGGDPFAKRDHVPNAKNSPVERLPKQKYVVSKKALQLEVKRIARVLGHLPTRKEVETLSRYPIEYYDRYFISWGEVCAAARTTGMSELPPVAQNESHQSSLPFDGLAPDS
jgi:site-specific DNA-methyltransferase (adenine-specific)